MRNINGILDYEKPDIEGLAMVATIDASTLSNTLTSTVRIGSLLKTRKLI